MTPSFAPGCFGSALAYRPTDMVCSNCPFASQCEPVHQANVLALHARFGIAPPPKPAPVRPEPEPVAVAPAPVKLPQRVLDVIDQLDKGGFDIGGKLRRGLNPFNKTMPGLQVLVHLLLRTGKPVARDTLVMALETHLGQPKDVARLNANVAILALVHVGVISQREGFCTLQILAQSDAS